MQKSYGYRSSAGAGEIQPRENARQPAWQVSESAADKSVDQTVCLLNSGELHGPVGIKEQIRQIAVAAQVLVRRWLFGVPAIIYIRYSLADTMHPGIDGQIARCRRHCETMGYIPVMICSDVAKPGQWAERGGWLDVERAVKAGIASVVVAESIDRVARGAFDFKMISENMREHGAKLDMPDAAPAGRFHRFAAGDPFGVRRAVMRLRKRRHD